MDVQQIGRLLIERHLLTEDELHHVLETHTHQAPPLDPAALKAAERLSDEQLWDTFADRLTHNCRQVNLTHEASDPEVMDYVEVHDAWNHLVLPLRIEDGTLVCATTEETAATALAMLHKTLDRPFELVISEIRLLEQFIAERYAYEGVDVD